MKDAVARDLPPYQIIGEVRKLRDAVVAELDQVAGKVEDDVEAKDPLVAKIEALKSNKAADELAHELGVVFPPEIKKLAEKVEHLLGHATAEQAPTPTPAEEPAPAELSEEEKAKVAELVAGGKTEEEATAEIIAEREPPAAA